MAVRREKIMMANNVQLEIIIRMACGLTAVFAKHNCLISLQVDLVLEMP